MKRAGSFVAVCVALLATAVVFSQTAPQDDPDEVRRRERERQERLDDAVRRAREGKSAVDHLGKLKVGLRELVSVTLDAGGAQRVVLVPSFQDKDKQWQPQADLVKALEELPRGYYTTIHTDEKYGLEWVVGVGEESPETLEDLEKMLKGRRWKPADDKDEVKDDDAKDEPVVQTAVGRFLRLEEASLAGKAAKVMIIERGVQMKEARFWLVHATRSGYANASKNVLAVAEGLKPGDRVEIKYLDLGELCIVKEFKKQ